MKLKPSARKALLVLAAAFAVLAPAAQAMFDLGMDQQSFAAQGDQTLRAAGYAFSLWGLIYAGLIAHVAGQLYDRGRYESLLSALSPSIIAIAGCGLWIFASAYDWRWPSVAIILVSAAAALWALMRARGKARGLGQGLVGVWPIALLGGWLLPASALNILTVMTAEGLIGDGARTGFALGGIAMATAIAVAVLRVGVSAVYGLPVAWGLVAVFVAERDDQPLAAFAALAGAVVVLALAALDELRRRASV